MLLGSGCQDPSGSSRIVWADVVSRRPQSEARGKVAAQGTPKYDRISGASPKVHLRSEGKRIEATPPLRPQQEMFPEDRRELLPLRSRLLDPLLPAPQNLASPEKRAVKTIWVDLRPLLEKVAEPLGSRQGEMSERVPQGGGRSSSNRERSSGEDLEDQGVRGFLGGRREDITDGAGEDHIDGGNGGITDGKHPIGGKHEGPRGRGEDLHGGRSPHTLRRTSIRPKAEVLVKDPSWPSRTDSLETPSLDPKSIKTSEEPQPWLPRNCSPAVVTLQPRLSSPVFLPRILPKLPLQAEAESSAGRPAAPSPDFHLPTRLLLRKLEETTTSKHHLVIVKILSALHEELSTNHPNARDLGEKLSPSLELPRIRPQQSGPADGAQEAPGTSFSKRKKRFPWKFHKSSDGVDILQ
ncbi:uncharacterized protein LOC110090603 [Pogona vitticeps]